MRRALIWALTFFAVNILGRSGVSRRLLMPRRGGPECVPSLTPSGLLGPWTIDGEEVRRLPLLSRGTKVKYKSVTVLGRKTFENQRTAAFGGKFESLLRHHWTC